MPAAKKKRKKVVRRTDPKQSSRFLETAKKLEVDETGKAFDRVLEVLAPKQRKKTAQ